MNRREFLKSALALAALAPAANLAAKAGLDGDKTIDDPKGLQVTRRKFRDTAQTVPLLGFGMMRLPLKDERIDYETAQKMVDAAMQAGCNYFDTAYMYLKGESEKFTGHALAKYSRDSYYLTSKMPTWLAKTEADVERIFKDQLSKCNTPYFDFYLVHALDRNRWQEVQNLKVIPFLEKMQQEGKIRRLGFSFHDTPEVLQTIVNARKWDFAQIQLNYLDWDYYRSREQYEVLTKAGIPVIVMEPIRGGMLAKLSPAASEILKKSNPAASVASWALRFVASLPNVLCVLSGMSTPEQMADNLRTFSPLKPLDDAERKVLAEALATFKKQFAVPCTGCEYCQPCPAGVLIPKIFALYNQYKINNSKGIFVNNYKALPEDGRADCCVQCEQCMSQCPQKIKIPEMLAKIAEEVK